MAKHTGPPESGADSPAGHPADDPPGDSGQDLSQRLDPDLDPGYALPPARFGRLALWAASASALTVGVAATVAYGVWFDQDQRVYMRAMATAQQTLSTGLAGAAAPAQQTQQTLSAAVAFVPDPPPLSTTGAAAAPAQQTTQQTTWSGQVASAASLADPQTILADAAEAERTAPASPAQPDSSGMASSDALAPHAGSARPATMNCGAKQVRHRTAPRVKPAPGLFARMESYFHRVNYRQHGNGSQQDQDLYAHS